MTEWLDRSIYPFESHYVALPDGKMHYVDAGKRDDAGPRETLLMLHGTPTWSFLYRHLITGLSDAYRVVAPDALGSGLSDKPEGYSYRPEDQARNLRAFIEALDLRDVTLVVHDFGGPIGLSYALDVPENVRRLVILNTWMWSLRSYTDKVLAGLVMGGPVGRFLYKRLDLEFRGIVPFAYGDRSKLTPEILAHYRGPFEHPLATEIAWIYARELIGSTAWYETLWERRGALKDKPTLLLWGMKDPVFGPQYLKRWQALFTNARTRTFPESGHFVQDEMGPALVPPLRDFLQEA
jgi:haloalkane dehalogenase